MTRAANSKAGRGGVGQERFPEDIKQFSRDVALTDDAQLWRGDGLDAGGAPTNERVPHGPIFPARIDQVGTGDAAELGSGQIAEETTHVITLAAEDKGDMKGNDYIRMNSRDWAITAIPARTDASVIRVEVKGA